MADLVAKWLVSYSIFMPSLPKNEDRSCHYWRLAQLVFQNGSKYFLKSNLIFTLHRIHEIFLDSCINRSYGCFMNKAEKILKGSLDLISSPSPSAKIQIMGGKVCLRCKGKTLMGIVNKLLKTKSLLTSPCNVLPYYLK